MMTEPITITEVISRSEQGATRPFFCYAEVGLPYRLMYCVKGSYAGKNSLCCEWVGSRLAKLLLEGGPLDLPEFRMAEVPEALVEASARQDIRDLGSGRVFASLVIVGGQELTWTAAQGWPEETMVMLLLTDLWLQNEDRSLSSHGGNPNLLVERIPSPPTGASNGASRNAPARREKLWVYDFNLAFDEDFDRARFFDVHVFGKMLKHWPEGFRERMEPRMKEVLSQAGEVFDELPLEWLHLDADDSLPVQLDRERVISALELPFTDPDRFWELP